MPRWFLTGRPEQPEEIHNEGYASRATNPVKQPFVVVRKPVHEPILSLKMSGALYTDLAGGLGLVGE